MSLDVELGLYIFILAGFLGFHLISRVPPLLHTPLMSATNALSGISLVGSLVVCGAGEHWYSTFFGFIAVACSSTNVVGGFLITDRMLRMFKTERDGGKQALWQQLAMPVGIALLCVILALLWFLVHGKHVAADSMLKWLYLLAGVLFILGLKGLSSPRYARQGMFLAEIGMIAAVVGTLFNDKIHGWGYFWIFFGMIIGSVAGGSMGLRIPMTAVPQRTAFSHSLGALAAMLIGIAEYLSNYDKWGAEKMIPLNFEVVIGGLTFTGSLIAAGKLQGLLPERPMTYPFQRIGNFALLAVLLFSFMTLLFYPGTVPLFFLMVLLALAFGMLLVMPIGAADMPVVIALLNSYAGLADAAMGFVLGNNVQIITGSLDGTSGFLLSLLMCRAMNRSATNVLFGAFGQVQAQTEAQEAKGTVRSITAEELGTTLEAVRSVVVVPGYGMAVAKAQHAVSDLAKVLKKRGIDVKYAIHPVAGRMPGHMNVLLAEAEVPYDDLYEME
ncbi:MAG TPA: NAD(P)(+) transhydrogenase (Re/Si-specific) subunit beta, partial [Gemmataceae bacterium]|nr:NAD(P)(+) transhydrogenase (Re/Si-specific) subunit beta [Gemmataceae bacterium]